MSLPEVEIVDDPKAGQTIPGTNFVHGDKMLTGGSNEVLAEAVVTDVNTENKTVTAQQKIETLADKDPVELASMMIQVYTPRFRSQVDRLSNNQLRRVLKSIVEHPIGKDYTHNNPVEKEVFALGSRLQDAKYVLIADTYANNRERILSEAAKAAAAAGEEQKKEETNNG